MSRALMFTVDRVYPDGTVEEAVLVYNYENLLRRFGPVHTAEMLRGRATARGGRWEHRIGNAYAEETA
jgi:hypothetical protein